MSVIKPTAGSIAEGAFPKATTPASSFRNKNTNKIHIQRKWLENTTGPIQRGRKAVQHILIQWFIVNHMCSAFVWLISAAIIEFLLACWKTQNPCSDNTLDEIENFVGNSSCSTACWFLITTASPWEVNCIGGFVSETTGRRRWCLGNQCPRRQRLASGCQQRMSRYAKEV